MYCGLIGLECVPCGLVKGRYDRIRIQNSLEWATEITVVYARAHSELWIKVVDHVELPSD